jgi:hypothetical protein
MIYDESSTVNKLKFWYRSLYYDVSIFLTHG